MKVDKQTLLQVRRNQQRLAMTIAIGSGISILIYAIVASLVLVAARLFPLGNTPEIFSIIALVGYYYISVFGVICVVPIGISVWSYKRTEKSLARAILALIIIENSAVVLFSMRWWIFLRTFEFL